MAGNVEILCVVKRPLLIKTKSCHHFWLLTFIVDHQSSSANTCNYRTIS